VIRRRPCNGIDSHADEATEQDIPCKAGGTGGRNLLGELDDLGLVSFLLEGDRDIGIALGDNRAWRQAGRRYIKPEMTASAPAGFDEMLIFSVVPRVTEAQPPAMAHSATIPIMRIY